MSKPTLILALASLLGGAACTGDFEPMSGDGTAGDDGVTGPVTAAAARAKFDSEVAPLMTARCQGCHVEGPAAPGNAPYFLGPEGTQQAGYYDVITQYPSVIGGYRAELASVLLKQAHSGSTWWTPDEELVVTSWLDMELAARAQPSTGGDGPVIPDPVVGLAAGTRAVFMEWAGCMTQENWDASNMGNWANKDAQGNEDCVNCHSLGLHRFNANGTNEDMFNMNRTELFIISFFTIRVDPITAANEIIPAYNKLDRMGNGATLHPRYNRCTAEEMANDQCGDQNFNDLKEFYDLTVQAKAAGNCGPPAFYLPGQQL